jgi:hypothetical protein
LLQKPDITCHRQTGAPGVAGRAASS